MAANLPVLMKNTLNLSLFLDYLVQKLSVFYIRPGGLAAILDFDLSRSSEVKSDFPPHLKMYLMVQPNYARSFMLFSKSA